MDNKIFIMIEISLNEGQKKDFQKNGFLIIESFLNTTNFERLYERFHNLKRIENQDEYFLHFF